MKTKQLRIRLGDEAWKQFYDLPPRARGQAVSLILSAWGLGVNLRELLKVRQDVARATNLLNQSLRTSWGRSADSDAASEMVRLLRRVIA
jgi:hypothetical protein